MKKEEKQTYLLIILRRDNNHIDVMDSDEYDKIFETYKELTEKWATCITDSKPFSLTSPVVTTFDPGLIYEITIKPIVDTVGKSKYDNPYQQAMMKNGLAGTLKSYDIMSDLKDGGYR